MIQTYSLENLLGERKKSRQLMLSGKQYLEGDSGSSSEEGDGENNKKPIKELVSVRIRSPDNPHILYNMQVLLFMVAEYLIWM